MLKFLTRCSTCVWIAHRLSRTCCKRRHYQLFSPPRSCPFFRLRLVPCSFCREGRTEMELTTLSHNLCIMIDAMCPLGSPYRLFWTTEDTSRATMPTHTAPMTTPKTMSHGGVSGLTGAARVGMMSMKSRVWSVSWKAPLMRPLDFLMENVDGQILLHALMPAWIHNNQQNASLLSSIWLGH